MIETKQLHVFIAGCHAGVLRQKEDGGLSFSYDDAYAGIPLSLSTPVSNSPYGDKSVRPYLFGLLPDNADVRANLGKRYGVSGNNPFDLLRHVGLDCPGAVQFCDESEIETVKARKEALAPVSDADIAARLSLGRTAGSERWETDKEQWSLGGQQTKFALRQERGRWYSCEGAAATTHILKPGISDLRFEALNEFVCLKLASACGIAASEVDYVIFEGEPAIVVTRYDRARTAEGSVARLHQEDVCQALGVLPENKYTENGGPSAHDVIGLLKATGDCAADNISSFVSQLFFNYLIGAPDAHAKNYSLLLGQGRAHLAPLYDVASMLPYTSRPFDVKLAMGIAGENRVGRASARRLQRFSDGNGLGEYELDGAVLAERLASLAVAVPKNLDILLNEYADIEGIDELGERMSPRIAELCKRSLSRL